jgi:hypothetical protein
MEKNILKPGMRILQLLGAMPPSGEFSIGRKQFFLLTISITTFQKQLLVQAKAAVSNLVAIRHMWRQAL